MKKFILGSKNPPNIENISPESLDRFIRSNIPKFRETGDCVKHRGGNWRKLTATNKRVTLKVKNRPVEKLGSSIRKVAKAVNISYGSVHNILHKNLDVKAYQKYLVQKMIKEHKVTRVEFAK